MALTPSPFHFPNVLFVEPLCFWLLCPLVRSRIGFLCSLLVKMFSFSSFIPSSHHCQLLCSPSSVWVFFHLFILSLVTDLSFTSAPFILTLVFFCVLLFCMCLCSTGLPNEDLLSAPHLIQPPPSLAVFALSLLLVK